jgi:predicted MPP superfamily phosphohydrolase
MRGRDDRQDGGDGVDRRGFLGCMAWAGTGLVWTAAGGLLTSTALAQGTAKRAGGFTFVQISDSHIGFAKPPNMRVTETLRVAITRINALPERPDFLIHTGDLTHLSTPEEFHTVAEILNEAKVGDVVTVPGEHDVVGDDREYLRRFGRGLRGEG